MPKSRPPYPPEYRERILELHRAGRSIESLAREFEPTSTTISNWVKQAQLDAGEREDGLTTEERSELRSLRREVKRLKLEREILEKAAAWFAREAGSIPKRDSHS
jgi:transposase